MLGLFFILLTLGLAALAGRLYQLQIHQHSQFAVRASSNFQRDDVITAVRGEIRTRDGVLLAMLSFAASMSDWLTRWNVLGTEQGTLRGFMH